jgi:hypothetical protein
MALASKPNRSVGPERAEASVLPQLLATPAATLEILSVDLDERLSQHPSAKVTSSMAATQVTEESGGSSSKAVSSGDSQFAIASAKSSQSQSQVVFSVPSVATSTQQRVSGARSAPKRSLKRLIDSSSEDERSKADIDDASSYLM